MPQQFKQWDGIDGLVRMLIPEHLYNVSLNLTCDNFYPTHSNVSELYQSKITVLGTARKNRVAKGQRYDNKSEIMSVRRNNRSQKFFFRDFHVFQYGQLLYFHGRKFLFFV